jgi:hypothetical protein
VLRDRKHRLAWPVLHYRSVCDGETARFARDVRLLRGHFLGRHSIRRVAGRLVQLPDGVFGKDSGSMRLVRAPLIRSSSRSVATSVSNRWTWATYGLPSRIKHSRPESMAMRTIQITFNTAYRRLSVHSFGSGSDSRSSWNSSSHMVSLGSYGKATHYIYLPPAELRGPGPRTIDAASVIGIRCLVGNRSGRMPGNPYLTRGVIPALQNHRKSLDPYTQR